MVWSFLIPAAATLLGAKSSSSAAKKAAATSAAASDRATELQQKIYEESIARQKPFLETGTDFFNRLAALQRGGPDAPMNFLQMDPGYGFRLGEGLKAIERSAAARGGLMSGATGKALQRYGQDLASQEYGAAYNRLAGMANIGPQAAGVISNLGQNYAGQVGQNLMAGGQAAAQGYLGAGSARGSSYIGAANALAGGLGQYLNYTQNQNLMNSLLANRAGMDYTPGRGFTYGAQLPYVGPPEPGGG